MSQIIKCTCKHDYQDQKNGQGRRVCNETNKSQGNKVVYRCTVCQKEHAA